METKNTKRDSSIDILRFIAIIGIIMAHSKPGALLTQLRGFDVILMVFLSAVCVNGKKMATVNLFDYFCKRGIRLILPVWIFLIFYYAGTYLVYYLPTTKEIIASFAFLSDRYVWIIRILLVLALATPLLCRFSDSLSPNKIILSFAVIILASEVLFATYSGDLFDLIFMTVPYIMIYILGMNINKFRTTQIAILATLSFCVFLILFCYYRIDNGFIVLTSEYKYPPRLFYTSYGLGCTLVMWNYRTKIESFFNLIHIKQFAQFVGNHTFWLYLWHIPMVDIVGDHLCAAIRFFLIFGGALICVAFQDFIVKQFVRKPVLISIFNG